MNDHDQHDRAVLLLESATSDLAPDVDRLVGSAVQRGRTLQRRRRVRSSLVAAAVVGVIGAAVSVSPVGRGGDGRAVDSPAVSSPSPSVTPSAAAPAAERRFGIDVGKTAAVLVSLLPDGASRPLDTWGSDDPGDQSRDAVALHEGGQVTVHLEHPDLRHDDSRPEEQCRRLTGAECRGLPDGQWYAVQQHADPGSPPAIRRTTVTLFTWDGFALAATAWNAPAERGVAPIQEAPVLEEAELLEVVEAPVWIDDQQ